MDSMTKRIMKVTDLSPDGYSRFFFLVDILKQIYGTRSQKLRILDVGGGSEFFEQQLKSIHLPYDLTILDIIERPAGMKATYIQADATNMDLPDNSYDVVVSTDVLEHIPPKGKQGFVEECLRVAKEVCIIAAPFNTEGVNEAEIVVNEFNKKLFGEGQSWLEEHLKYGKPEVELLRRVLKAKKIPYDDFGTQNLTTWLFNTHINLIDAKLGLDRNQHINANKYYDEHILQMNEFIEPTYRHFFVMYKDAGKKKLFNPETYTKQGVDSQKVATYTSMLMEVLSERMSQLRENGTSLAREVEAVRRQNIELEKEKNDLSVVVREQQAVLKRLSPLVKVIKSKPARATHRFVQTKKRGNSR